MAQALGDLARAVGLTQSPPIQAECIPTSVPLNHIHDSMIEQAAMATYRRDYLNLGFGTWTAG